MDQKCKNFNMMVPSGGTPGLRGTTLATGEEHKANHNSGGIDDADGANPSGHLPADVATSELRSLRCTKVTKIGTWNIKGMNIGKLDTIQKEMNRLNIDILGVSEVHWTGNGFFNSGDHTMYFLGNSKTRQHGVGFVLYKKISKYVESYQTISDRVITIRIKAKPNNITLLQIYARTADAKEDEIEQFYAEIPGAIEETP
ncbi:craniofacial development protein 2-like [Octopus sinensis]|uniref:Craniofacial development protein 2-like n=1 Tax=Octopus sinensis TaxID=2607531 RepID=A0A6P7SG92_9MOLL|nr:craniofacial development protein 2-like [Octopus sinensis]